MSIQLPEDFKEFLRLLSRNEVLYLLVGGYAVGFYGFPQPTGDMDIWISNTEENSTRALSVLADFGISSDELTPDLFAGKRCIVRMGVPPFKLEIITFIDGVEFDECYARRVVGDLDGLDVNMISLPDLITNKAASGRPKDLNDLENLPSAN